MAETNEEPKSGDLRVAHYPQVPGPAFRVPVPNVSVGKTLIKVLVNYDLFQFETRIKPDYCNTSTLEVLEDGQWCDWYHPDTGESIWEVIRGT